MTDETIELPSDDAADIARLYAEPDGDDTEPEFHPILEVWREVLRPAADELTRPVTPNWANRIVTSFTGVTFRDMNRYRDFYFGRLLELANILDLEIASDPHCLTYRNMTDDAQENAIHYKNLLLLWQMQVLQWELDWNTMDKYAAVDLAAISEVHKMFFGSTGLTQFLDNIGFEFTDDDSQMLLEALAEFKGGEGE